MKNTNMNNKNNLYIAISMIAFVILAFIYAKPVLTGKALFQHDIVQYRGGAKELLDYRTKNDKETYWSDSMFGGMPTYQMGAQFRGDLVKKVDQLLMKFPKPVNYLFLLLSGFFILGLVTVKDWRYALLGATFFGLSTYFYIIIAAGHNGKVHTIAYFAPLLAGIFLVFYQKKYFLGFLVTTVVMGLQLAANHPQMTYYLFLALGIFFLSELIRAIKDRSRMRHFLLSSFIVGTSVALGVGMNAQRIMANSEYVKETVRGKQILSNDNQSEGKSGMDKESMLMWSYGKLETLNLFIPRLMGGGSNEPENEKMMQDIQDMVQQNVTSQEEMDRISKGFQSLSYWGDQPGTSGPAYQGAVVCFLALLGFFFAPKKYRYWILGACLLTFGLAWGSNFMALSDFFIDFVPFYNKFRAPSSILVITELLFPLIAIIGLYNFYTNKNLKEDYKKKVVAYGSIGVLAFLLILIVFGKNLLGFYTSNEKTYLPPYILDYLIDARYNMFKTDALKTFLYTAISGGVLWMSLKKKLSVNIALVILGVVSLFDLWTVDKNYLNDDNFVDKVFAENPFQTEVTPTLIDKVGDNSELQSLLVNANVNKTLQDIAEKDQGHYRIYNQAINPFGETNTSYFKSSVGGYHAVKLRRYDDLINTYFSNMDTVKVPRILNMLNAKYMIFGDQQNPQAVPNPKANGNAWLVSNVQIANSPNEEINLIGEIDSKKTAIIGKEDLNYLEKKNLAKDSAAFIDLKEYEPNRLVYESQSKTPQFAVFSEIYYPKGWKVKLDGNNAKYIKTNYLLRGMYLPAGKHTIEMVFDPDVIHQGKNYSLFALIIFVLAGILGYYLTYVRKPTDPTI